MPYPLAPKSTHIAPPKSDPMRTPQTEVSFTRKLDRGFKRKSEAASLSPHESKRSKKEENYKNTIQNLIKKTEFGVEEKMKEERVVLR